MAKTKPEVAENPVSKLCGIVMPISECDGCPEQHWVEVKSILTDAIGAAGFESNLVSFARDVGVIHERIVRNLYENPIVVCDVSGRNSNVMFELGMRLAFDKPTIIIKDDRTSYSFDTSGIEHLEYPRDLRFKKIIEFKERLASKIVATLERSQTDKEYTTFLGRFGKFQVAQIETTEVSKDEYYQRQFDLMKEMLASISHSITHGRTDRLVAPELFEEASKMSTNKAIHLIRKALLTGDIQVINEIKSELIRMPRYRFEKVREYLSTEKQRLEAEIKSLGVDPEVLDRLLDFLA